MFKFWRQKCSGLQPCLNSCQIIPAPLVGAARNVRHSRGNACACLVVLSLPIRVLSPLATTECQSGTGKRVLGCHSLPLFLPLCLARGEVEVGPLESQRQRELARVSEEDSDQLLTARQRKEKVGDAEATGK